MAKKLKFEKKAPHIWVAFADKNRRDIRGRAFKGFTAVRVIKESEGFRADFTGAVAGAWMPWEPITSVSYKTLAEAKRVCNEFVSAPTPER